MLLDVSSFLEVPELAVLAVLRDELLVGSCLHDLSFVEDDDVVCLDDRGKPVSDDECGPVLHEGVKGFLDFVFCCRV